MSQMANYHKWHVIKNCQKELRFKISKNSSRGEVRDLLMKIIKTATFSVLSNFFFLKIVYAYCERLFITKNNMKKFITIKMNLFLP